MVASPGEHTVKVYPDQGDLTPVRIVTSNDEGSVVEVTHGPFKGVTGFVPRQNVD